MHFKQGSVCFLFFFFLHSLGQLMKLSAVLCFAENGMFAHVVLKSAPPLPSCFLRRNELRPWTIPSGRKERGSARQGKKLYTQIKQQAVFIEPYTADNTCLLEHWLILKQVTELIPNKCT